MIPKSTIEEIREKVDLVGLVESRGVSLRRMGASYKGLCPVHDERSPSFNVNPNANTYKCFGCGIGGDAINFLQEVDGLTFVGAVEALGDLAGVEVVDSEGDDPDYNRRKTYIRCVKVAAMHYRQLFAQLPEDHPAKVNIQNRDYYTVPGRDTWLEDFGIGYAPESWDSMCHYLRSQGFSDDEIVDAGVAARRDNGGIYDRFRNRLLWEIRDLRGNVIGFSGRRLNEEDNPKYLNTSETLLYSKSKTLFGLDLARKKMSQDRVCYVAEGAADAMALAAVGVTNVVASCGTAFGSEHATMVRRIIDDFDAKSNGKFIFVFDGDAAGVKASMRMFTDIKPSIKERSYVVSLGDYDPVDYRKEFGPEKLLEKVTKGAEPITMFMLNRIALKYDLQEAEQKSAFIQEATGIISFINDPVIYDEYKKRISYMTGTNTSYLNSKGFKTSGRGSNDWNEQPDAPTPVTPVESLTDALLNIVFQYPEEAFEVLYDESAILSNIKNPRQSQLLGKAMSKILHDVKHGMEHPTLTINDFPDALDYFHAPIESNDTRLVEYTRHLVQQIHNLRNLEQVRNVRSAILQEEVSPEEALKLMLAERAKARR